MTEPLDMEVAETTTSFVFGQRSRTSCGHTDTYLLVHYVLISTVVGFDRMRISQCPVCNSTWES